MSIEDWWQAGEIVELPLAGRERQIFRLRTGRGPMLTLLHGFPSSSHDWWKVAPALAAGHTVLAPDFLGFGASEKPSEHEYSLHEQADLVEALWAREGVTATSILAHDYAVSVTQELLARRAQGDLAVELLAAHLLNGGLYPELHRPQPTQLALLDREQGPRVSAMLSEELMSAGLAPTFSANYDSSADRAEIWHATSRGEGQRIAHLLIRYITDREAHRDRWVRALEDTDVPLAFVWGMLDPVSGAHMAEQIRRRLPDAPFSALAHVSHWPALEAPERVAASVLSA